MNRAALHRALLSLAVELDADDENPYRECLQRAIERLGGPGNPERCFFVLDEHTTLGEIVDLFTGEKRPYRMLMPPVTPKGEEGSK